MTEMRQNGGQQPAVMQSTCVSVRTGTDWQMPLLRTQMRIIKEQAPAAGMHAHEAGGAPGDGDEDVHPPLVCALRQPRVDDHGRRGHRKGYGRQEGHLCRCTLMSSATL